MVSARPSSVTILSDKSHAEEARVATVPIASSSILVFVLWKVHVMDNSRMTAPIIPNARGVKCAVILLAAH